MFTYFSSIVLIVTLLLCSLNLIQECYKGDAGLGLKPLRYDWSGAVVERCKNITLTRCVLSIVISLLVAGWGMKRKSLDWSGAIVGVAVGLIHTFSSYCFLWCLFTFFFTSSKATKFHTEKKKKLESEFKEGGQRNWHQVLCNGGASTEIALIYLLNGGPGEFPIQFHKNYFRSLLSAGIIAALAGANGDTWASEIGTVMAKEQPLLITSFKKVPVGTNGGFTRIGLLVSALGGVVVGLAYFVSLLFSNQQVDLFRQACLLMFIGAFSGFFGSLFDSFIGATLQYSGQDIKTGKIVEKPGIGVIHISGRPILNNHTVNMIMTIVTSIVVPTVTAQIEHIF